jgi:CheY-like chemotaxis protein
MTAHVLIVEDDPEFIGAIQEVLRGLSPGAAVRVAQSRDAAMALLAAEFFDIIILDLKIPTADGALDADSQHGFAVFRRAQAVASGTPVFVLTGSPAEDFIPELLGSARQIDIWGEGRNARTVDFLPKYKFDAFPETMRPSLRSIDTLADVELDRSGVALEIADDRLIRIFARRYGGARVVMSLLGGGLSGAKVLRLRVTNAQGAPIHDAVAKIGSMDAVVDEGSRFDRHVARLEPRATPRKLITLEAGAKTSAGVFYGLAAGFDETAFQAAMGAPEHATATIRSVEGGTDQWRNGVNQSRRTVQDIRRRLLRDEHLEAVLRQQDLGWVAEFEKMAVQTRWCCGHGDMHGENVLVAADGSAVIIDYGDVDEGTASLDPVTLELSLLFHPKGPLHGGAWPTHGQAASWGNLDQYVQGCPAEAFVRECRAWAGRAAAGNREIAVTAFAYLMRQLKYEDTDKALALALLNGVKAFYDAT